MKTVVSTYENARIILDNLFLYVALLDNDGRVIDVNGAPLVKGGYKKEDIIGQFFYDAPWWQYDPDIRNQLIHSIQDCAKGKTLRYDVTVKMGSQLIPIDFMISPIRDAQNNVVALLPSAVEITQRKVLEEKLAESEEQYRFVLEGSELGFWDWNIEAGSVKRNKRWAEMLGYSHAEIMNTTKQWTDFIYPDDREKAWNSINDVLEGRTSAHKIEYRMLHKDGSIRWILDQAKIMKRSAEGKPLRMCGTHTDITDRKNLELILEKQAHIDFLTGLDNRRHFLEKAEAELHRSQRYGSDLSILMLDIDYFKKINDTYGHLTGDMVLQKIAGIFRTSLREIDLVGRIGGEEFAILLPETDLHHAHEVAERLRTEIKDARLAIEKGLPVQFTVSIGIAARTLPDENLDVLLSYADKALYASKHKGRNKISLATEQD